MELRRAAGRAAPPFRRGGAGDNRLLQPRQPRRQGVDGGAAQQLVERLLLDVQLPRRDKRVDHLLTPNDPRLSETVRAPQIKDESLTM